MAEERKHSFLKDSIRSPSPLWSASWLWCSKCLRLWFVHWAASLRSHQAKRNTDTRRSIIPKHAKPDIVNNYSYRKQNLTMHSHSSRNWKVNAKQVEKKKKKSKNMSQSFPYLSRCICNGLSLSMHYRTLLGGSFTARGVGHIRNGDCVSLHYRSLYKKSTKWRMALSIRSYYIYIYTDAPWLELGIAWEMLILITKTIHKLLQPQLIR